MFLTRVGLELNRLVTKLGDNAYFNPVDFKTEIRVVSQMRRIDFNGDIRN